MKVSCVLTTWRRFHCVERAVACFLGQDYGGEMELIIFNTDIDFPIVLSDDFVVHRRRIKVINCGIDFETKKLYTNTGAIRRDALTFATGTHYITWDDDDIFFPWDVRQRVDGLWREAGARAWKPYHSFMKQRGAEPFLSFNYMEASVLVEIDAVREHGFKGSTGPEHLAWFEALLNAGQLVADELAVPGYCFYWADPVGIAGHKQSDMAEFSRLDNFERHKAGCTDIARRKLACKGFPRDYTDIVAEFSGAIADLEKSKPIGYEKYIAPVHQAVFSKVSPSHD